MIGTCHKHNPQQHLAATAILALAAGLALAPASRAAQPYTAEAMWQLQRLGDPAISPDGRLAVVPVTKYDMEKNKGDADLSILFTSDAQLFVDSDKYTILEDDKGVLPAGNVIFISDEKTAQDAGPDYQATIEKVQEGLSLEVMQELNARVDIDKQKPADVAAEYLQEAGYTE